MVANYTIQGLGQEGIPLIWSKEDWNCQATFVLLGWTKNCFFQMKKKTLEDAQKYKKQKEEVEKEKEKENKKRKIKVKKKKKRWKYIFFHSNLVWVV